jgi:hypothetical protein
MRARVAPLGRRSLEQLFRFALCCRGRTEQTRAIEANLLRQAWTRRNPGTFVISIEQGFEIGRRTNAAQLGAALAESAA